MSDSTEQRPAGQAGPDNAPIGHLTTTRTRAEHIEWSRTRALAELDDDADGRACQRALASMASDLSKHDGTAGHSGIHLGLLEVMGGFMRTSEQVRKHLEGFR